MNRSEFVEMAMHAMLTRRQAEAFHRRHIEGQDRTVAADKMDTSPSNIDNLERAARDKIRQATNLTSLVDSLDYDAELAIGVCAECQEPTESLRPRPGQDGVPMEDWVMICKDCRPNDT
jgi:transcriptional regulator